MPTKVKEDLLEQCEIDQNLFEKFVKDRIQSGEINLWSPMKKRKLQTWKTMGKKIKVSSRPDSGVTRRQKPICMHDGDL